MKNPMTWFHPDDRFGFVHDEPREWPTWAKVALWVFGAVVGFGLALMF